jgi:hypothetical protein
MKYIVTESQYKLITESEKYIKVFQDLIENELKYIRRVCDMGADDFQGDVGDESCKQIENVEKIDVTDAEWVTIMHSNRKTEEKYMRIRLMVYYRLNQQHGNFDADDLTYDLERILRNKTTMPLLINYDSTNLNKHFDW